MCPGSCLVCQNPPRRGERGVSTATNLVCLFACFRPASAQHRGGAGGGHAARGRGRGAARARPRVLGLLLRRRVRAHRGLAGRAPGLRARLFPQVKHRSFTSCALSYRRLAI